MTIDSELLNKIGFERVASGNLVASDCKVTIRIVREQWDIIVELPNGHSIDLGVTSGHDTAISDLH